MAVELFGKEDIDVIAKNPEKLLEYIKGHFVISFYGIENINQEIQRGGFDRYSATRLGNYKLSEAGELSRDEINKLNNGEVIPVTKRFQGFGYCIQLDSNDIDYETVLSNNGKVIWYEGGWTEPYTEKINKNIPLITLALTYKENKMANLIFSELKRQKVISGSNYYEVNNSDEVPIYFDYDDKTFLITTDKESIQNFDSGGYNGNNNLGQAKNASKFINSIAYAYTSLIFNEWPKSIKDNLNGSSRDKHPDYWDYENEYYYDGKDEIYETYTDFLSNEHPYILQYEGKNSNDLISKFFGDYAKNLEIIQKNNYESELNINTISNGKNSLFNFILTGFKIANKYRTTVYHTKEKIIKQ